MSPTLRDLSNDTTFSQIKYISQNKSIYIYIHFFYILHVKAENQFAEKQFDYKEGWTCWLTSGYCVVTAQFSMGKSYNVKEQQVPGVYINQALSTLQYINKQFLLLQLLVPQDKADLIFLRIMVELFELKIKPFFQNMSAAMEHSSLYWPYFVAGRLLHVLECDGIGGWVLRPNV